MPDPLVEIMRCAPSTRRFTAEPVDRKVIERVLDDARFAPSGGNRQGWRVIVVTEPAARRRLRELYEEPWRQYTERNGARAVLDDPELAKQLPAGRLRMLELADEYAHSFDQAPIHLVILVAVDDLAIVDSELPRPSIVGGASVYPFVQNVLLGLRAHELGAAFTTLLTPAEAEIRQLLGFPPEVIMAGHIAVGHRADPWPQRLSRRPVSEFAFAERWGEIW